MSFSAKGELIYLAHPRTASIATERALAKMFPRRSKKTANHHAQLHEITFRHGDEKIFTTIRNPLDMIVSWYVANSNWHDRSMLTFILDYKHSMMDRDGDLFYFTKDAHKYIRWENLQQEFNDLMNSWGFRPSKIPVTNVTKEKTKHFMNYHDKDTIDAMWHRWPRAMEMYHDRP